MMPATEDRPPRGAKRLVHRLRQIRDEYLDRGLRAEPAWREVMAALREMERRNETRGSRR